MKKVSENPNEPIIKRLNVLINLAILKDIRGKKTLTARDYISILDSMGLRYLEIAEIFGKSPSYIASELTQLKKKGDKHGRGSE